jgi:hypothetical protein
MSTMTISAEYPYLTEWNFEAVLMFAAELEY